ncbi:MAG: DUF2961 domain-containing protein [Candidatus Hydrogenedentes bacterium]|nr:DUF2961 domain-containing protein [Candidatus Hydrogenedentota bacterium]
MRCWKGFAVFAMAAVAMVSFVSGASAGSRSNAGLRTMNDTDSVASALEIAGRQNEQTHQLTTFNLERRSKTIAIPRGKTVTIGEVKGKGYIANLWMTFPGWFWQHWNKDAAISPTILKTLILRIYWDGASKPAVEAPAGDFFGVGLCEVGNFASNYVGTSSGGFFCKFPMPFRKGFRIEVENVDETIDTDVFMNVLYQLTDEIPGDAGYFHAQFHTGRNDGPIPIDVGQFEGKGQYVGITLSMQGQDRNYLSFLEAPEYVYIDEDWEKPRITGTGLEDYFMGGWYFREGVFAGPLHGLPVKDTLNASVAMYRFHDQDAIRFTKRFKMQFVNPWDPDRLRPFAYSSVAYAYVDSPEGQGPALPGRDGLLCWYRLRDRDHQSIP